MMYKLLFRLTAWWAVPKFKYLFRGKFRQVGKAKFNYTDDNRPTTEVWYRSSDGRWARLIVEVMPRRYVRIHEEDSP